MAEVLRTRGLTKRYGGKTVLEGLDLSLESGHIYGLLGPEGAGKTTLLRLLAGLSFPTSGSFSLFGETFPSRLAKARKRVGFLIDEPIAAEQFSLRKNLELQAPLTGRRDEARLKELRRSLGLTERGVGHRRWRDCAAWERRRYGLAAALLGQPELLALDEPMNGLDPEGVRMARELLGELNRDRGVTMLITGVWPEELRGLATDYLFLDEGRLLRSVTAQALEALDPDRLASELLRLRETGKGGCE